MRVSLLLSGVLLLSMQPTYARPCPPVAPAAPSPARTCAALPRPSPSPSPTQTCAAVPAQPSPSPARSRAPSPFLALYAKLHDARNGYYSAKSIPYHSRETLMVEAPDHGHETTSEALSYSIWLESMYGKATGDWRPLQKAWTVLETFLIPQAAQQSSNGDYNPSSPATYAPEFQSVTQYPAQLDASVPVGNDPIAAELKSKHGPFVYGMHWLLDVDNWYGFGSGTAPTFINTFQRGSAESVWKTIPQPSIEDFSHGGPNGFLDLFTKQSGYAKQWRYTAAPDADARAIEAVYWAKKWADQQGGSAAVDALVPKAARMGDWLRYSFFDKYFKPIGCQDKYAKGKDYSSAHMLMAWYYGWGGPLQPNGWAFRIGSSHIHFGYQNPMTAWILSQQPAFSRGVTANSARDWKTSLERQIQFFYWLQSAEGGIAGGVTNSWNGRYEKYPAGTPTFFGMAYQANPVYDNPPSNGWFGMQTWGMERMIQYYGESRDPRVLPLIRKWVAWVVAQTQWTPGAVQIPATLAWSGAPDANFASPSGLPGKNTKLHVTVVDRSNDVGLSASLARALWRFGTATSDAGILAKANALVDSILLNADAQGFSTVEKRADYSNFATSAGVPPGWTGRMPNGDIISTNSTFLSIRSKYKADPMYTALAAGKTPTFRYHRFWAQTEIALTLGLMRK